MSRMTFVVEFHDGQEPRIRWDRILNHLVRDHDWSYQDTRPNAGVITVPPYRVNEVQTLVRTIVPAGISIDVVAEE